MIATYRLSERLASFEFFCWLVMVKAAGATKIVLDPANPKTAKIGGPESTARRFESIIVPGPALAGLPSRIGSDKSRLTASANSFTQWVRQGGVLPRLQTVKPAVSCKYTITLRNNFDGAKSRNSNDQAWRQFGEEIGATIIEDYFVKPMHLHDRVALYAGAKMNFGVSNGPVFLISLTNYPVAQFINSTAARNNVIRDGMRPGEKAPWMLSNQHLIWEEDNIENLRRAFRKLQC